MIVMVVLHDFVMMVVAMANLVMERVGVGAVTVTVGAVLFPEMMVTGDGVIVIVVCVVEVTVAVTVGAVDVEVILTR